MLLPNAVAFGPNDLNTSDDPAAFANFELIRFSHTSSRPLLLAGGGKWRGSARYRVPLADLVFVRIILPVGSDGLQSGFADAGIDAGNRTEGRQTRRGFVEETLSSRLRSFAPSRSFCLTLIFWPVSLTTLSVPVLLFLLSYSYAKRFTAPRYYWLSTASRCFRHSGPDRHGMIAWQPFLFPASSSSGLAASSIIYARQDADFDCEKKLLQPPSAGILTGSADRDVQPTRSRSTPVRTLGTRKALGPSSDRRIMALALLIYEHSLVRSRRLTRVNIAFFNVNSIVSSGLLIVGLTDRRPAADRPI